jgi:predicted ATP-grasp superfamily ATP-dependent carboligase
LAFAIVSLAKSFGMRTVDTPLAAQAPTTLHSFSRFIHKNINSPIAEKQKVSDNNKKN